MERLQKVLAQANIASRRKSEGFITSGRVKVNGIVITELGYKVDKKDKIEVDGKPIELAEHLYFLLNKPVEYVSNPSDEKNRPKGLDLIDPELRSTRLYPVGRLDFDTAGLLLLTNDGDFTNKMTHPEHEIEKEYLVRCEGIIIRKLIVQLREGVLIDGDYMAIPKSVRVMELNKGMQSTLLSITLTEGRNKEVRKMCDAIGHPVRKLTRIRYDVLTLEGVERGSYRPLKPHEIKKLYANSQPKK